MATETKYTKDHEWLSIDGDTVTVGITNYAQEQLGDLVFVYLPKIGQKLEKAKEAAVVESVKAASDVYSSITGEVLAVNSTIVAEPGIVNSDPMAGGWFFKVRAQDKGELTDLMDESKYQEYIK